jgi:hypothetical protein
LASTISTKAAVHAQVMTKLALRKSGNRAVSASTTSRAYCSVNGRRIRSEPNEIASTPASTASFTSVLVTPVLTSVM